MIGEKVQEARLAAGLSLPELAARIRDLRDQDPNVESVDRTSLARIESGATLRPRDSTLRAIALALEKSPAFFIAQTQRPWKLSICAPHAIFSAPAILAALTSTIEGTRFTTFGAGEADELFEPTWSSLGVNGNRKLLRPRPPRVIPDGVDVDIFPMLETWPSGEGGDQPGAGSGPPMRVVTAAKIIELWKREEVDVAVVSAEVFKHEDATLADAVNCCTLTHNSGRGVRLIALYDPAKVKGAKLAEEFPGEVIDKVAERMYSDGKIIVPAGTFASTQVERIDTDVAIIPFEIRLGNYDQFVSKIFEHLRETKSGVLIVALWEPFVTFLRRDWEVRMNINSPDDWLECSLGQVNDIKSTLGLPPVLMDVLVRKKYLDEFGGVPLELDHFLANLQKTTSDLNDQIQMFRKNLSMLKSLDVKVNYVEKFQGKTSKDIRLLALYYGLSEYHCARSIAQIGFEIGYAPDYVQYLKKLIGRRSGVRDVVRARLGEAA